MTTHTRPIALGPRGRLAWRRIVSSLLHALGLPFLLLGAWGLWSTFSANRFFPSR